MSVKPQVFTPHVPASVTSDPAELFILDACLDYSNLGETPESRIAAAHSILAADPSVAIGSLAAVATVGDHVAVASHLSSDPLSLNRATGPNGWPPLLYATYSRISAGNEAWSAHQTVRLLLDHGADPDAGFLWNGLAPPFTALTGAIGGGEGHQPRPAEGLALARLLLEAGADPNDGQLLYNNGIGGAQHDDPSHLELLSEFGLGTSRNGCWYEILGDHLRKPSELLYDELEAAAHRNRPVTFAYLMSLGLDLDRGVGRSGLTPLQIATARGNESIVELLGAAGVRRD